jgi:hypothetical protein
MPIECILNKKVCVFDLKKTVLKCLDRTVYIYIYIYVYIYIYIYLAASYIQLCKRILSLINIDHC